MSKIGAEVLAAFRDELHKHAGPIPMSETIHAMLGGAGSAGGAGALAGGLLGAGVSGVKRYREARDQGGTVGQSVVQGVLGAPKGALRGAAIGGGLGAVGGGITGALSPEKGKALREALHELPGAQFGQRQVHGLTGWTPEKGLGSIGLGAETHKGAIERAEKELARAHAGERARSLGDRIMGRSAVESAGLELERAREAHGALEKAEQMGLTSIPGYAKSLRDNGVGKTLGTAFNAQWKGTSPAMKAMMVGLPALDVVHQIRSEDENDAAGHSKTQRVGRALASTAGGMLLGPMAMGTQMVANKGLDVAADQGARLIDKVRGKEQKPVPMSSLPQDLTSSSGQAVPSERVVSERAGGPGGEF